MEALTCENCGGSDFSVVDNVPTCNNCGTRYPDLDKGKISRIEKLKEEEIERLLREKPKRTQSGIIIYPEPKSGLLTDDEIIKHAPKSRSARQIRLKRRKMEFERKSGLFGYFKTRWMDYYFLFILFVLSIYLMQYNFGGFPYSDNPYFLYGFCLVMIGTTIFLIKNGGELIDLISYI